MVSLEARVDALVRSVEEESRLMDAQLAKSRAARAASHAQPQRTDAGTTQREGAATVRPVPASLSLAPPSTAGSPLSLRHASPSSPDRALSPSIVRPAPSPASPSSSSPANVIPLAATHKEGPLLHLVRSGGLFGSKGTSAFVPHYVVVSGSSGISWYASRAEYAQQPQRPLGHADFWVETQNSRGSRFKKAAVCWPLILPEDCPAAADPRKTYFAVDYYTANGSREQLVLAAESPEERDAWVQLLTKYIDLYLAPRAESEELQHIPRGAAVPLHRSGVLEGEAPGGTIL